MGKDVNTASCHLVCPLKCGYLIANLVHKKVVFFPCHSLKEKLQHFTTCNGTQCRKLHMDSSCKFYRYMYNQLFSVFMVFVFQFFGS
ncbi:hypothetical protein RchiOBHm_Chr7g0182891 [Rosa chinensis]|uniref:Uncharacterized protein n=1 Tax=Rosa chinensis TaxID=74649 RepID=A0A2P6P305_ROSCH|nr:hypothetical protein RchiOBHm_Chr7g0182891 [Rosa chinensis]